MRMRDVEAGEVKTAGLDVDARRRGRLVWHSTLEENTLEGPWPLSAATTPY